MGRCQAGAKQTYVASGKPFASLCPVPGGSVTIMTVTLIAAVSSVWEARAPSQAHRSSGHQFTSLSPTEACSSQASPRH